MVRISHDQIKFHPHSFGDHHLRVFQWNGEIYRGMSSEKASFFKPLFQAGLIQKLVEKDLLIESELTSLVTDSYELVVRHRRLPFPSYPNEWCAAMLRDAALTLLNLAIELTNHGLTLGDAHPWNLLVDIDKCKPVFVDIGSIGTIRASHWSVYDEFCYFFLYPLILIAHGQSQIARLLICEDQGVRETELLALTRDSFQLIKPKLSMLSRIETFWRQSLSEAQRKQIKNAMLSIRSRFQKRTGSSSYLESFEHSRQTSHTEFLKSLKHEIERISIPSSQGENVYKIHVSSNNQDSWNEKQRNLYKILLKLRPTSVLDVSIGTITYSKLAAVLGSKVVTFGTDEDRITQLYCEAKEQKLPILPLIMDFAKPTPSRGLISHRAIAATERFQCEMVLAFELVNYLVIQKRLSFDQIVEGLISFSQRWLLVDFNSIETQDVNQTQKSRFFWYTCDNFIDSLKKRFRRVTIINLEVDHQILLLCEK